MKIAILSKYEPVPGAESHKTAWDSAHKRFRIIGIGGNVWEPKFTTRRGAEKYALKMAKLVFRKADEPRFESKKIAVLGNELKKTFDKIDFYELDQKFDNTRLSAGPSIKEPEPEEDL